MICSKSKRAVSTLTEGARERERHTLVHLGVAAALGMVALATVPVAEARITRIDITQTESPTFGGYAWTGVGQYEKIVGKAYGEIDPTDRRNAVIADIALAPR